MDFTNLTTNDTFLTGEQGHVTCAVDRTLASTPAPIAMSTVGRDRGVRRNYIHDSLLFSTSPPAQEFVQNNAEDSLGLLPPEYLLGMSNSLLPLETINNGSRQGAALTDSCSSKELSSESHETLATVKKRPLEPFTRTGCRRKPQVLFQQVDEEEDAAKADSFKRNDTKDLCLEAEAHRSSDSGVGQTMGSYAGQTISRRSHDMCRTNSSDNLDGLKTKTDTQTFFYSLSRNSSNTKTTTDEKSGRNGGSGEEDDLGIFQSITRSSSDNKTGTLKDTDKESGGTLFDNFPYKVNIKADLQNMFSDLGLRLSGEGKDMSKNDIKETRDQSRIPDNTQDTRKESSSPKPVNEVPLMDGPFKMPLLPRAVERIKKAYINSMNKSEQAQAAESTVTDWGPSIHFGESFVSQKADSTTDWGPSIQFGDSAQQPETNRSLKESPPLENDLAETQSDSLHQRLDHHETASVFGDQSCNPFEGFGQEIMNVSEEFLEDAEAKINLLNVDHQQFVKENPFSNLTLDVTIGSYRGPDDTFMNLTIGTYMAARSNEFDDLTCKKYNRERPDIGMPVYSPPAYRRVLPIIQPSEIYSPINIRSIGLKPVTDFARVEKHGDAFEIEKVKDQDPIHPLKEESSPTKSPPRIRTESVSKESVALVQEKEMRETASIDNGDSGSPSKSDSNSFYSTEKNKVKAVAPEPQKKSEDANVGSQNYNLQDGTINMTSDMTFDALHKLIEGLDSNMSHPEHLILSEVNRHLEEKKKQLTRPNKESASIPDKQAAKIFKDPSDAKEDSVFKQPLPVKRWAPKSGKVSKAPSFRVTELSRLAEHPAIEASSLNMHFEDLSSMSLTMSLVECSLPSNGVGSNSNINNSSKAITQSGEPGQLRFQPQLSSLPPASDEPSRLAVPGRAEPSKTTEEHTQAVPYSDSSTFNSTMETQAIHTSNYPGKQRHMKPRDTSVYGQCLMDDSTDVTCTDTSSDHFHTLCPADNSQSIWVPKERGFASSTPMPGMVPNMGQEIQEKTILPMITPQILVNLLTLPRALSFLEVTCVMLSQETSFSVTNAIDKGVKVSVTIREVTCRGQRMTQYCPFDVKPQIILSGNSSQDVLVMFRPKQEGEHTAKVELFAVNMIRPQETRIYQLIISACAEKPQVKIWPDENVINFGTLPWGMTKLKSIKIQNNGQATVPLVLSISKKEASMCSFTFLVKDAASNKSSTSFMCPPDAKGSVLALSLPGVREGQEPTAHTLELCCKSRAVSNIERKYQESCENFQAMLDMGLDMPVNGFKLKEMKLLVTMGMYKLHVDKESLLISALPGRCETGCINVLNSGNIPMSVELGLTSLMSPFSISTTSIVVPPGDKVPVNVTFSPQPSQERVEIYTVYLSLSTSVVEYSVTITGKVKGNEVKITSSQSEINFGGVDLGYTKKQSYTFVPHGDTRVTLSFRNAGGFTAFKLLNERGHEVNSLEMAVQQGKLYEALVSFCPTDLNGYSAELILRTEGSKFMVPVRGYGGRSCVEIKDLISHSDELLLNVGRVVSGQPVCYKMNISNTGPRCCFVKALIKDLNGVVFPPVQASIVPPLLLLPPHGSADVMVMIFPSQREYFSSSNQLATIKLIYGDEVNRQHFLLKPSKQGKQHLKKFDLPMNNALKEIINHEMKALPCHEDTYSVLKKSLFKMNIKVIGQSVVSRNPSQDRIEADFSGRLMASSRPVLSPLSPNIKHTGRVKDEWTVAPKEIWINGDQPSTMTPTVQVINFSVQELRFYTECGENISVFPSKGIVKSKDTTMLHVSVLNRNIGANWFGLIHVLLSPQDRQVIKVFFVNPAEANMRQHVTPLPVTDHRQVMISLSSPERPTATSKPSSSSQPPALSTPAQNFTRSVQGSDKAILTSTEAGSKSYSTYNFTNTSQEPLTWKLVPFLPPYVKDADDTHALYRVDYEVFKLIPSTGTLQADETEKVTIEFSPRSRGYFNHDWSIVDAATKTQISLHSFTIMGKGLTNTSRESKASNVDSVPEGLSRTSLPSGSRSSRQAASSALTISKPGYVAQLRGQTPVANKPMPEENVAEREQFSLMPSPSLLQGPSNESQLKSERSERPMELNDKTLTLVDPNVQFPKVPIGGTMNLKISIKNTGDKKVEIAVDYEPRPPFLIRNYNFKIDKDKMVLFPVTFKPKHKGHFTDKLVFKEKASGIILTAYLEAEC